MVDTDQFNLYHTYICIFYGLTLYSFCFHGFRLTNNGANLFSFGFRLAQKRLVMWSWALILVVCTPYAVIFLRNLWKVISFTSPKWFGFRVLFTVSISSWTMNHSSSLNFYWLIFIIMFFIGLLVSISSHFSVNYY